MGEQLERKPVKRRYVKVLQFPEKWMELVIILTWMIAIAVSKSDALNLSYSDVANLGQNCQHLDSCNFKRLTGSRDLDSTRERNCACDYLCSEYGDCCIDASFYPFLSNTSNTWKCSELRQFGGVYMKSTCQNYHDDSELVELCENTQSDDFSDPLGSMPVTDFETGFTYKNYYCAMCNQEHSNALVFWTPRLECPTLTIYNRSHNNLTHDFVFQNLMYDGTNWGLYLDGDNGSLFFHDCVIDPVMPHLLENKIRLCKIKSVANCPDTWADDEIRAKCSAYTGIRYYHSESYKNAHCAICNGVNVSLLTCQPVEFREMFVFRTFEHRAFSLLLDINEFKGKDVGLIRRCNESEVFDPFFKKCRSLVCLPGYIRERNKCVPLTSTSSTPSSTDNPLISVISVGNKTNILDSNASYEIESHRTNDKYLDSNVNPNKDSSANINNLTGISYNTSVIDNDSDLKHALDRYKDCLLIVLQNGSYIMFENKTIYVAEYDQFYEPTKYFSEDGSVLICSFFSEHSEVHFSPLQAYFTEIGLGVSMFFLLLHFLIFCIVPDLQNLSGKNLLSQCVALFHAYLFFIISQVYSLQGTSFCSAVAFLTFFFFQASFFWMNVMAFDVWRTLRMATTELRVSIGKQRKRFLFYSLYSWMIPFFIVSLSAVAEYSDAFPEDYRPRFAQPLCWFNSRRALMIFFAIPLLIVVLTNVVLFVSSAKMIIMTTKNTTVKQQNSSQKRNFKLYLRLAILMGLTWAVGLIAACADLIILWYLFIIMNTLQGLFIFVAFSCSTKVLNHLRDCIAKYTKAADFGKSAIHSTTSNSGCNSTALTSAFTKSSTKYLVAKKQSASPTNSSASNCSRISTFH